MRPSATSNSPSEDPSLVEAPILHVDLDAFFASVEILDDPRLVGRPVAVGGAGERGVIASASYEARRYGVRSAMASVTALRRCPGLIILPGRFERYEELSAQFHGLIGELTSRYEPLGLDEAFCDLRGLQRHGVRPVPAAHELAERIRSVMSLECGVGVARNKLFAKLASREAKSKVLAGRLVPGPGVFYVDPGTETRWLAELPVRALWGVGPATAAKLDQLGLGFVRDLARVSEADLSAHLGSAMASTLVSFARGEDPREVLSDRPVKSLGHEQTFGRSLVGSDVLDAARTHAGVLARTLRERGLLARTLSVIVRYDERDEVRRSQTLAFGLDDEEALYALAEALLGSVDLARSVRLLGLHASSLLLRGQSQIQLRLDVDDAEAAAPPGAASSAQDAQVEREALRDAVDEIRRRFGQGALTRVSELGTALARQRGAHAFGPSRAR